MAGNYGANQYKTTSIKTATPGQLLIMLYESAIKSVKLATECMEKKDIAGKGKHICKVHDIINELTNTLNFEAGGNIAEDLERLYTFMSSQLLKGNLENSKECLQTVQKLLETLLSGWKVAVTEAQKSQGNANAKV